MWDIVLEILGISWQSKHYLWDWPLHLAFHGSPLPPSWSKLKGETASQTYWRDHSDIENLAPLSQDVTPAVFCSQWGSEQSKGNIGRGSITHWNCLCLKHPKNCNGLIKLVTLWHPSPHSLIRRLFSLTEKSVTISPLWAGWLPEGGGALGRENRASGSLWKLNSPGGRWPTNLPAFGAHKTELWGRRSIRLGFRRSRASSHMVKSPLESINSNCSKGENNSWLSCYLKGKDLLNRKHCNPTFSQALLSHGPTPAWPPLLVVTPS